MSRDVSHSRYWFWPDLQGQQAFES